MHTVLRSRFRSFLLPSNARRIRELLKDLSKRFGVSVYQFSINSNHIHLLTRARTRHGYQDFMRAFSGTVALKLTGSKKGIALEEGFWECRPWSRIVQWGKAFFAAKAYVLRNQLEAEGVIAYQPRLPRANQPKSYATVKQPNRF